MHALFSKENAKLSARELNERLREIYGNYKRGKRIPNAKKHPDAPFLFWHSILGRWIAAERLAIAHRPDQLAPGFRRIPPPPRHALHVFSAERIPIPHPIFLRLYSCPESVVPEEAEQRGGRRARAVFVGGIARTRWRRGRRRTARRAVAGGASRVVVRRDLRRGARRTVVRRDLRLERAADSSAEG
jgi:hypothetical protein